MTEINIERKQRRSIWPWLIGALLLVLAITLLRSRGSDDAVVGAPADSAVTRTSTGDVSRDSAPVTSRP